MLIIFPSQSHQVSPAAPEERRLRHSRPFVGHRLDLLQDVVPCNVFSASVGTGKPTRGCGKLKLSLPICSMYSIFTYIWAICGVNVGKYSIHGAYGLGKSSTKKGG